MSFFSRKPRPGSPRTRARISVEWLEDRLVPAGWALSTLGSATWGSAFDQGDPTTGRAAALYTAGNRLDSANNTVGYLGRYDAVSGALSGSQTFGLGNAWDAAVDPSGSVYVSGTFSGSMTLGSTTLVSAGSSDAFVAKLDPSLNVLWAHSFGGTAADSGNGVAADAGGVYVATRFQGAAGLDGNTAQPILTSAGDADAGFLKFDAAGTLVYAARAGGTGADIGISLTVDGIGRAYVTGYFAGTASFSSSSGTLFSLASSGYNDAFVAQLNATGQFTWARQMGGASANSNAFDMAYGVALDGAGRLFVSGKFGGTGTFGDAIDPGAATLTARGTSTDAYVTCLDVATDPARGNFLWTRQLGGAWIDMHGRNLAVDGSGNVYAVGDFIGSYTVNDGPGVGVPVLASGSNDGYLEKLSGTGDLLGVWQMGGKGGKTKAVEIGADGSVYTAGEFGASGGPSTFDTGTAYTALTGTGTFVSKMTQEGLATVVGRVLVDKGTIGVQDAADVLGMAPHTVTLTYNDGVARTSTVTTGPGGLYRFGHLPAVAYTITQTPPAGWTQSYGPAVGTLAAGAFATGRDFGNTSPTATRTYANTTAVKIKPSGQYTNSTITIANTSTVYDINVKLDITYPNVSGLSVRLIAPNGTRFHLVSTGITGGGNYKGTIFDDQAAGRPPASSSTGYAGSYRPAFALAALNGQPLNGKWTLQVFNTLSGTSGTINSWSLEVTGRTLGSPLMVAGGQTAAPIESAVSLTEEQLRPIVRAAVARWEATGLTAAQRNELEHVDVRIADLAPGYLGMTGDNTIWIDTDAAGWGWFVDATPWDDSEFATPGNQGEQNRVDLLSALMHEMGHKLGSDHHADGLMAESLAAGTRLVPDSPTPAPDSMGHRSGMAERGLPHETRIAPESVPAGSPFNGVGREGAAAGYDIATLLGVRVDPTPIDSTATISVEHLGNPQGPSDGTTAMRLGRHTVSGRFKVESLSISPAGVVTGTFSGVNAFVAATGDRLAMTTAPVVADGQSVRTVVFDAIFTVDSSARTGRLADATSSFRMIASAESISLASGFIPPFRRSWVGDGEHVLRKGKK